jgi:hypothetical protein
MSNDDARKEALIDLTMDTFFNTLGLTDFDTTEMLAMLGERVVRQAAREAELSHGDLEQNDE